MRKTDVWTYQFKKQSLRVDTVTRTSVKCEIRVKRLYPFLLLALTG